jgi:hypothetical protein
LRCNKKIGETMMREFLSQYSIVSLVFLAALWSEVEAIHIPGSFLALQAMLSGKVPIFNSAAQLLCKVIR